MGPSVIDANTSKTFFGMIAGKAPVQMQVNFTTKPTARTGQGGDGNYIVQATTLNLLYYKPASSYKQITFFLQYLDPNTANNWITYDAKYPEVSYGINTANLVVNTTKDYTNYNNILKTGQFAYNSTSMDPRTGRWGMVANSQLGSVSPGTWGSQNPSSNTSYLLETTANSTYNSATLGTFSVLETDRPRADKANLVLYATPCAVSQNGTPGPNNQMHWFSGTTYYASAGSPGYASPFDFMGLFTQNNPALLFNSKGGPSVAATAGQQNYVEDADGMVRLAMGGYNTDTAMTDSSTSSLAQTPSSDPSRIGLPEATASTVSDNAVATATAQTQSRPMILNRPFRSVSEMSYAFQGTPWKNIDFFTPASGDSALLDTFCLTQPPASAMVAGKVDLNTRQIPVLQALVAGAYRDEFNNVSSPPSYALPPLSGAEANNVATKLVGITSDTTHAWRGPLKNISGLVGRFVASPGSTTGYSDFYTYAPASPANGQPASMTYAGLSAALDSTVYTNSTNSASASAPYIQRFREAGLRPLVDAGQVRVWNLLIDVVAQTGRYPKSATGFDQFVVNGQTRLWVHVAIDRYTGQVIDKQVEVVTP